MLGVAAPGRCLLGGGGLSWLHVLGYVFFPFFSLFCFLCGADFSVLWTCVLIHFIFDFSGVEPSFSRAFAEIGTFHCDFTHIILTGSVL